jgi:hypothetical protein
VLPRTSRVPAAIRGHRVLPAGGKTVWAVVAADGPADDAVSSEFPRRRSPEQADRNAVSAVTPADSVLAQIL